MRCTTRPNADEAEEVPDFEAAVDSMSLVKNDDLEIAVAIAGIVSKVTSQFSLPVMQLTRRIDSLCPDRTVTERLNPLGPHQLGAAFVGATDSIEIDIRVRIVLLKLFERFVMEHLGQAYEDANRAARRSGRAARFAQCDEARSQHASVIQPRTDAAAAHRCARRQCRRRATFARRDQAGFGSPGAAGNVGRKRFHSAAATARWHTRVMAAARLQPAERPMPAVQSPAALHTRAPLARSSRTPDLMSVLSAVQSASSAEPIDIDQVPVAIDLRQFVLARASDVTGAPAGSMGRTDEDTVNLVGMLFDYILNDRNLAIPMKALIGRLQIPMLKVAILDKTFFNRTSHPARQLLNELSSAGIGWSSAAELKRDALYNKIESVVLRVLNNFSDDPEIFGTLVAELRNFVQQDHHRVQIVEQRVKEVEAGRAKTISAKQTVERLVNQKASWLAPASRHRPLHQRHLESCARLPVCAPRRRRQPNGPKQCRRLTICCGAFSRSTHSPISKNATAHDRN